MSEPILSDEHVAAIAALAEAIIPADDFDGGVAPLDPGPVIATRARYQAAVAQLYTRGLAALEQSLSIMFPGRRLPDLSLAERGRLLTAMRNGAAPGAAWREVSSQEFYRTLRGDVCFVYTTDPEVCRRIGFPGPSTSTGGYPDFDRPQA